MKYLKLLVIVLVVVVFISGCKNVYQEAVRECLNGWKWWQENYYIQDITSYEMLAPYYIQKIPYVKVFVNIDSKYSPYKSKIFDFYVRKDCPCSSAIPKNSDWFKFIENVKCETHLLTAELPND